MELARVPVVEAKIRPASLPAVVLRRRRYMDLAALLASGRLTTLVAPGGYGKTTFLASFATDPGLREPADPGRRPVLASWYSLDEMDGDIAVFLTHLTRSIARAVDGFGTETLKALSGVPDLESQCLVVAAAMSEEMWQVLADSGGDLTVLLDDYQAVAQSKQVNDVVQYLLANAPANVHFCVSSRRDLPLRLEKLALQGQVRSIGPEDLSFGLDEIKEVLGKVSGKQWTEASVNEVAASTEGWPAGVVLIGQSARQGWDLRAKDPGTHDREATFRYFAEEILSRLDEDMRAFLTGASFLRHLTSRSAAEILGVAKAADYLNRAVESGLFITRLTGDTGDIYRFHHVFQAFLRRGMSREGALELHRSAAVYYAGEGMLDAAMGHYMDAGLTGEASALLERTGLELIDKGQVDILRHWLSALPQTCVDASPRLLYFTGFVLQNANPSRAIECLDRAAKGLADQGELGLQVRALIYMATIYSLQNQVDKVKEVSSRIPVVAAMRKDSWSRGVLTVSALCQAAWEDNLRRGVWLGRLARHLPLDPDWLWAMLAYSCMIYYRLGDLDTARRVIEEGLALPVVKFNDYWLGLGLTLYHVVLYLQDDDVTAEGVREQLWNLGEKYDSPYYKAYAERARAHSHHQRGRFEQGVELLKSSLYFFEKAGNLAMANMTRMDLCLLETVVGDPAAALPEAKAALANLFALQPGQGLEETAESSMGAVAREAGELALAEEHLLHSASVSKRKGAKQVLMGTYLHLAQLYAQKGEDSLADRYLSEALSLAERGRFKVFWDFHRPTLLKQCRRAIERGIHPEYARFLLSYWMGEEAAATAFQVVEQSGPVVQAGAPLLDVKMLGAFEVSIGGKTLPERSWQTRKVKALFKYLVLNRSRHLSRDEVMDLLWPDSEPAAAAASLRVTLSRLRKALAHAVDGDGQRASCLRDDKGFIWFEPAGPFSLDADLFERSCIESSRSLRVGDPESSKAGLEQAVAAYRGDLLEEDLYEDWPAAERERLQMLYLNALQSLAKICLGGPAPEYARAIDLLLKAIAVNPYREETYLALMTTYHEQKQTGEALRVYERCRKMLQDEFGVKPGKPMQDLAAEIRRMATVTPGAQA